MSCAFYTHPFKFDFSLHQPDRECVIENVNSLCSAQTHINIDLLELLQLSVSHMALEPKFPNSKIMNMWQNVVHVALWKKDLCIHKLMDSRNGRGLVRSLFNSPFNSHLKTWLLGSFCFRAWSIWKKIYEPCIFSCQEIYNGNRERDVFTWSKQLSQIPFLSLFSFCWLAKPSHSSSTTSSLILVVRGRLCHWILMAKF